MAFMHLNRDSSEEPGQTKIYAIGLCDIYIRQKSDPHQLIAALSFEGRLLPKLVTGLACKSHIRSLFTNSSSYAFSSGYRSVSTVVVEPCSQLLLPLSAVPPRLLLPVSLFPRDISC